MVTGQVLDFKPKGDRKIAPKELLEQENFQNADQLVILGWGKDGQLVTGFTHHDLPSNLYLTSLANKILLDNALK